VARAANPPYEFGLQTCPRAVGVNHSGDISPDWNPSALLPNGSLMLWPVRLGPTSPPQESGLYRNVRFVTCASLIAFIGIIGVGELLLLHRAVERSPPTRINISGRDIYPRPYKMEAWPVTPPMR
jgi:hypothetical protein